MNTNELAAQLEFFRDIGVDSLDVKQTPNRLGQQAHEPAREGSLESIRAEIGDCQRCKLAPKRTNIVFGSGSPTAELDFVGEAPVFDEHSKGLAFVVRASPMV